MYTPTHLYTHTLVHLYICTPKQHLYTHGRPQEFFQGGANLWGGPQKICEGGPPYFFRQALKCAYRGGGGCSFDARRVFF